METFIEPKELVENSSYQVQREKSLSGLREGMIDVPLNDIINGFNRLPYCFTLQSCYGHFVYKDQYDPYSLASLPLTDTASPILLTGSPVYVFVSIRVVSEESG